MAGSMTALAPLVLLPVFLFPQQANAEPLAGRTCNYTSSDDKSWGRVVDAVKMIRVGGTWVPVVTFRTVEAETIVTYRWCVSRKGAWIDPMAAMLIFRSDPERRFHCSVFTHFQTRVQIRDGRGHSFNPKPWRTECVRGWYANSSFVEFPRKQRFYYRHPFGYPRWEADAKAVHNNWNDHHFPLHFGVLDLIEFKQALREYGYQT